MGLSISGQENGIVFRKQGGEEQRANLVSLSRDSLVFEVYTPDIDVDRGQAIPELTVYRGGKPIYSGGAAVSNIFYTGGLARVSARPLGQWVTPDEQRPAEAARALVDEWEHSHLLSPAFELAVMKLRSFLYDLSRWVTLAGVKDTEGGGELPTDVVEEWCTVVHPRLGGLFQAFESAARDVPREEWDSHRAFTQRELHPLTLCAPFVYRTYVKPLGYAGDYEMVNMILRNRPEGPNIFAAIVNTYFLRIDVAQGHRNRIDRLVDSLQQEAARVAPTGRPLRILNLGCGPAVEVSRFIRSSDLASRCDFTLLDFNQETIDYAGQQIRSAIMESGRKPTVRFVRQSIGELLKDAARGTSQVSTGQFDFVYCAGLFDYLSDRVCTRLLELMYRQTLPGGLVTATNVDPAHTSHAALDALGEWHLILRSSADMRRIAPIVPAAVWAGTEPAGTNVFLEMRKPNDRTDDDSVNPTRLHSAR